MPRRYRRKGARWENPCSPLQAARFARRWIGQDVCDRVQDLCPGHSNGHCRLDPSKLSEWEHDKGRPSMAHIQALCEVFQTSAEDLGLITWNRNPGDPSGDDHAAACARHNDDDLGEVVLGWVRANATIVLAEAFQAVAQQLRGFNQNPEPPSQYSVPPSEDDRD